MKTGNAHYNPAGIIKSEQQYGTSGVAEKPSERHRGTELLVPASLESFEEVLCTVGPFTEAWLEGHLLHVVEHANVLRGNPAFQVLHGVDEVLLYAAQAGLRRHRSVFG